MLNNLELGNLENDFGTLNSVTGVPGIFGTFAYIDEATDMTELNTFKSSLDMSEQLEVAETLHLKDSKVHDEIDLQDSKHSEIDLAWMHE